MLTGYPRFNPEAPFDVCVEQLIKFSNFYYKLGNIIKRPGNTNAYDTARQFDVPEEELDGLQKIAKNIMATATKPQFRMHKSYLKELSSFTRKMENFMLKTEWKASEESRKAVEKALGELEIQISRFPADIAAMEQQYIFLPDVFDTKMHFLSERVFAVNNAFKDVKKDIDLTEDLGKQSSFSPTTDALKDIRGNTESAAGRLVEKVEKTATRYSNRIC